MQSRNWMIALALAALDCACERPTAPQSSVAPSASAPTSSSWTVMEARPQDPLDEELRAAYGRSPQSLLARLGFAEEDVQRLAAGTTTAARQIVANFDEDPQLESAIVVEVLSKSAAEPGPVNASVLIAFLDGPRFEERKVVRRDEVVLADVCFVAFDVSVQNVHSNQFADLVGDWYSRPRPCRRMRNGSYGSTGLVVWSLAGPSPRIAQIEEAWHVGRHSSGSGSGRVDISIVGPAPKDIRVMRDRRVDELVRKLTFNVTSGRYE